MTTIQSLDQLYSTLLDRIDSNSIEDIRLADYRDVLERYEGEDWRKYVDFDPESYHRVIFNSYSNSIFEFILICWDVGQTSPIHDHPESGCLLKILQGGLKEELYRNIEDEPMAIVDTMLSEGSVSYRESNRILHRIDNSSGLPTVSLHIYSPPNYECRSYE
jgi:cysteine dioxygenase